MVLSQRWLVPFFLCFLGIREWIIDCSSSKSSLLMVTNPGRSPKSHPASQECPGVVQPWSLDPAHPQEKRARFIRLSESQPTTINFVFKALLPNGFFFFFFCSNSIIWTQPGCASPVLPPHARLLAPLVTPRQKHNRAQQQKSFDALKPSPRNKLPSPRWACSEGSTRLPSWMMLKVRNCRARRSKFIIFSPKNQKKEPRVYFSVCEATISVVD